MKKLLLLLLIPIAGFSQIFSEDFESGVFPPTGWSVNTTNAANTWISLVDATSTGVDPITGDYSAVVFYNVSAQNEDLISPSIDLSGVTAATLSFNTSSSFTWGVTNDNYDITCQISSDGGTTWTTLWSEDDLVTAEGGTFQTNQPYNIQLDLASYLGAGFDDVMLKFNYTGADGDFWSLDDISISSCAAPDASMSDFTSSTVDLDLGSTGDFDLEWGIYPYTQDGSGSTATVTAGDMYQFTSLDPATTYNVFVRRNCTASESSDWVEVTIGTTPEVVTMLPYETSFEFAANQALLLNLGNSFAGETGTWGLNMDDNTDGDTTNDFASDGLFSFVSAIFSDADYDAYLFMNPVTLTAGTEYKFSFDHRVFADATVTTTTVPMSLDAVVSSTNDGMGTTVLGSFTGLTNVDYENAIVTFTPDADGVFYFGLHNNTPTATGATTNNFNIVDNVMIYGTLSSKDFASNTISTYPNPAKDVLNINAGSLEVLSAQVVDLNGRVVLSTKGTSTLNVSALSQGAYLLTVVTSEGASTQKFIKK